MAKKKDDGHRMGERFGYTLLDDGSIKVAPVYVDRMAAINTQEEAINRILQVVVRECTNMMEVVASSRKLWWKDVTKDYGLDENTGYYYTTSKTIKKFKEK